MSDLDPAVDQRFLADLAASYGETIQRALVATFLQGLDEQVPRRAPWLGDVDARSLAHLGHLVRGCAANFRAVRLSRLAHEIEAAATSSAPLDRDRMSACVAGLRAEVERVRTALDGLGLVAPAAVPV